MDARIRCIHGRGHGRTRRLVSANLEHDLATRPAARDPLERRAGLRARKNRVDALPFPGTQSANDDSYSLYATWPVRLALIACTTSEGIGVHRAGMYAASLGFSV